VEERLKDATVVAPFDGVIVVKNVVITKTLGKLERHIMAVSGMTGINEPESVSKISTSA
jgi:hypothetical protein